MPAASSGGSGSSNCSGCGVKQEKKGEKGKEGKNPQGHPRNYTWSELMKRVFGFDVLKCNRCGGRMRILCAINSAEAIKKILDCLGLPSRPPPIFPAVLEHPYDY